MKICPVIFGLLALCLLAAPALAHWPTTVEENIAVAADPDTFESYPKALALPGNRTLIMYKESSPGSGWSYQILDRFGNMAYPDGQPLIPNQIGQLSQVTSRLISDGAGGALAAWAPISPVEGIYAQRLDSLGNQLWGDDGAQIFFRDEVQFDICWDGEDGFWLAVAPGSPLELYMYLQHIDGQGNLLLGDSGLVVQYIPQGISLPYVLPDGQGGCISVWQDGRIAPNAIVAQRYNPAGHPVWSEDLIICTDVWWKSAISDGEGGVIVQAGSSYNRHWRVNGAGQILWERDHLSWGEGSAMVLGEPGYFYLAWYCYGAFYAQRMALTGHNLWPTYGSGQYGAPLSTRPPPPGLSHGVPKSISNPPTSSRFMPTSRTQWMWRGFSLRSWIQPVPCSGEPRGRIWPAVTITSQNIPQSRLGKTAMSSSGMMPNRGVPMMCSPSASTLMEPWAGHSLWRSP